MQPMLIMLGWFGSHWQNTMQLMLMVLGLDPGTKPNAADANHAGLFWVPGQNPMQVMLMMLSWSVLLGETQRADAHDAGLVWVP